jgi:hypothetical protein
MASWVTLKSMSDEGGAVKGRVGGRGRVPEWLR